MCELCIFLLPSVYLIFTFSYSNTYFSIFNNIPTIQLFLLTEMHCFPPQFFRLMPIE